MSATTPSNLASEDSLSRVRDHLSVLTNVIKDSFAVDTMLQEIPIGSTFSYNERLIDSLFQTLKTRAEVAGDIVELLSLPVNINGREFRAWIEKSKEPGKIDLLLTPTINDYVLGTQTYKYTKNFAVQQFGESIVPSLDKSLVVAGHGNKKAEIGTELYDIYYDQVDEVHDTLIEIKQLIQLLWWMPAIIKAELIAEVDELLPELEKYTKSYSILVDNNYQGLTRFTKDGCGFLYTQINKSKKIIDYVRRYRMKREFAVALTGLSDRCQSALNSLERAIPNIKTFQINKPSEFVLLDVPLFSNDYSFDAAINGQEFTSLDLNGVRDMVLETRKELCDYAKKVISEEKTELSLEFKKLLADDILQYAISNRHAPLEVFKSAFDYKIEKTTNPELGDFIPTAEQCKAFIDDTYAKGSPINIHNFGMIEIAARYTDSLIMVHDSANNLMYVTTNDDAKNKAIHISLNKNKGTYQFNALLMPQPEMRQAADKSKKQNDSASQLRHLNAGTGRFWSLTIKAFFASIVESFKVLASYVMINPFAKTSLASKYRRDAKDMLVESNSQSRVEDYSGPEYDRFRYDSDNESQSDIDSDYDEEFVNDEEVENESEYGSHPEAEYESTDLESSEETDSLVSEASNRNTFGNMIRKKVMLYKRDPAQYFHEIEINDLRPGNMTNMVLLILRNYFISQAYLAHDDERSKQLFNLYDVIVKPLSTTKPDFKRFHENVMSAIVDGDLPADNDFIRDIVRIEHATEIKLNGPNLT